MNIKFVIDITEKFLCVISILFLCNCSFRKAPFTYEREEYKPASCELEDWGLNNVKENGALGDGKTDDTDAIQKCIAEAERNIRTFAHETTYSEVVFPEGTYIISRPIVISPIPKTRGLFIRGVGKVTIRQKNPDQDIFYIHNGFRHVIENISFDGGKRQIKFFTGNKDTSNFLVRNCRFYNASSYAIDDALKGVHYSKIVPPYTVTMKDGMPQLKANEVDSLPDIFFTSSLYTVENCEFYQCMNALRVFADWAVIKNCKIETHPDMRGAAIYSRGVLKIKNVQGIAHVKKENHQRWIDNINGGVMLENVNFDAVGEIGMCPVFNRRIYDNGGLYNIYVIIDRGTFKAAGSPENCIVYCEEVPNLVAVRNSKETSGKKIPVMNFRPDVTKKYLQYVSFPELVKRDPELARIYGYMVRMPRIYDDVTGYKYKNNFSFSITDNNENLTFEVPEVLKQFIEKPLPESIQKLFTKQKPLNSGTMNALLKRRINVRDFGALTDRKDDTEAIQKAFDEAGKTPLTEVVFPNGIYLISKPIQLPRNIAIRGLGKACFQGNDKIKSAFTGKDILNLSLQNLGFYKVQNAVEISTKSDDESKILIDVCSFSRLPGAAVICSAGNGSVGEKNKTCLRITNSVLVRTKHALISNVNNASFDCNWITTRNHAENCAIFVNKGRLEISDMITVPRSTFGRWIENYQTLIVDNMRFGAEGNRKNNLVDNKSENGKIAIENSWMNCRDKSMIYCEKIPSIIALRSNLGIPADLQTMITVNKHAEGDIKKHFYESCNIPPTTIKYESTETLKTGK